MNKKYLPSALILYLNYFIHGVGCSILGQAVIKEALAASWGVEAMAITAISAALGLGRLIALPFAGPLSDKLGRRISTVIGSGSYAIYLIGLALAFNAGTNGGYQIAYVCAIVGGIANSFLDTGIYPAVSEIIYKARPGQCGLPVRQQLVEPDRLQAAGAGHAAGGRHTGLHRGVGSGRCGHRADDHLQYAGARSSFRRGADRPERLRNAQENKIKSQKRAAAQSSVQQPVL